MRIDVLTLFPGIFNGPLDESILDRAQKQGLLAVHIHDLREFTTDRHNTADDYPFGGGSGMVLKPEPLFLGVEAVQEKWAAQEGPVLLMTPQGKQFNQEHARRLARNEQMLIICGRYEGVDERVRQELVTDEISIGDYVLTGGELPALIVIDAVARMLPGVVGDEESVREDSFYYDRLEHPHYTRPRTFRGFEVPEVLLSGDHQRIARWRKRESLRRTLERRPDLFERRPPDEEEEKLLLELDTSKG